jgi:biotin carboxyl carrier protein
MRYLVTVDEREVSVAIEESQSGALLQANVDDVKAPIDWSVVTAAARSLAGGADTAGHYSLLLGATSYDIYARPIASPDDTDEGAQAYEVTVGARTFTVTLRDERTQALGRLVGGAHHSGDATIRAPMPGLVSNVLAQEGQEVERGQAIVVLEAMKMENDLTTPRAGVIKRINVTKGQTVNQGETLAIIGDSGEAVSEEAAEESDTDMAD